MKRTLVLLFTSLFLMASSSLADTTNAAAGGIDLKGVHVTDVLPLYQNLCSHKLIIDSRVKSVIWPITIHIAGASLTKGELVKQFREALLKQAGVVITPLNDRQESVTCNDALPIGFKLAPAVKTAAIP